MFSKQDISKFSRTRVNRNGDICFIYYLVCHLLITYTNSLDPESEVIKLFSCSTQLRMKLVMVIYVKMPTINMINTVIKSLKARKNLYFSAFKLL